MLIVVTGPESTGKSTLTQYVACEFGAVHVNEYAREYLKGRGGRYSHDDLRHIAEGQARRIREALSASDQPVISDTWKYEIMVWERYRFEGLSWDYEVIFKEIEPDILVLCRPDLAWEYDDLRENPHDRDDLFTFFEELVLQSGIPYIMAEGPGDRRMQDVVDRLRALMGKSIP